MELTGISEWILAAIAAIGAIGLTVKLSTNRKSSKSTIKHTVTQNNNSAGRDIIGGDSIDKSKK